MKGPGLIVPTFQLRNRGWVVLRLDDASALACPREHSSLSPAEIPISVYMRTHASRSPLDQFARAAMVRRVPDVDALEKRSFREASMPAVSYAWTDGILDLESEFVDVGDGSAIEITYSFDPRAEGAPSPHELRRYFEKHVQVAWAPLPTKLEHAEKRKQSLYFDEAMLAEIKLEAARLDRSMSWVVQRAWKIAIQEIRRLPGSHEPEAERMSAQPEVDDLET